MFRNSWAASLFLLAACDKQQPPGDPQSYEVHFPAGDAISTGGGPASLGTPGAGGAPSDGGGPAAGGSLATGGASAVGGAMSACEANSTRAGVASASRESRSLPKHFDDDGPKIVGGGDSAFTWAVAITSSGTLETQYCGGALIDDRWVLTAAHCNVQPGDIVVGGRSNLTQDQAGGTASVVRVLTHSKYWGVHEGFDIALLELNRTIGGTSSVRIPSSASEVRGQVTAVGWGRLKERGASSPKQQKVSVSLVSNESCSKAYDRPILASMLCAGAPGKDSCQGDSGGPIAQELGGKWTQVGIVSWGKGCARPDIPGVYTNLMSYLDWINACKKSPL